MKKLPLFLLLMPVVVAQAQTPSISGKWKVHQAIAGNESDSTCTFVQTGNALTGTCGGDSGTSPITGTVDGNKVKWAMKSDYNGTALTISFSGVLASGKITGDTTVDPFGVSGDFTAVPDTTAK